MGRRSVLAWGLLVLAVLLALPAAWLRTDNGMDEWLPFGDVARQRYQEFKQTFGSDHFAVVASVDRDEAELVAELRTLTERLRGLPGVERVLAPITFTAEGVPVLDATDPLQQPLFARTDRGAGGAAFVGFREGLDSAERAQLLDRIETLAAITADGRWRVAGPASLNRALDRHARHSSTVLVPIAATGVLAVLIVALASLRAALVILSACGLACGSTLGVVQLSGRPMHMLLSVLPALLMVLGTAYALHPVTRFLDGPVDRAETLALRWRRVLRETVRPALVAAATTAAGLGSLMLSDLAPVRDLGAFGALGIALAFVLAYTVVPVVLLALRVRPYGPRPAGARSSWAGATADFASRRGGAVLCVSAVLLGVAAVGVARLPVESNVLRLLPSDAPVRTATAQIEAGLFGLTPVEVWLRGAPGRMLDEDVRRAAHELADDCRDLPLVTHVLSPYDAAADSDLDTLSAVLPSHVRVTDDVASMRLTLCTGTVGVEESHALAERARGVVADHLPVGVNAVLTGSIPLLVQVQRALVSSQIRSFAGALVLVTVVLWLDLRSLRLALISLVPNVAPALMAAGVMGWLGTPLDAATVAVAGLALGLAVDDTVHVLHGYRRNGGDLETVFRHTARPIVFTTLAAVTGFGGFVASDFPPARRLGLLIAGAALAAVAADLLLLPALLGRWGGVALASAPAPSHSDRRLP